MPQNRSLQSHSARPEVAWRIGAASPQFAHPGSLVATLSVLLLAAQVLASPPESPAVMQDDATLHDVFFVDAERGWAVGDRGAILFTEDGGRHWSRQISNTTATLRSVHFSTPQVGWAVGGWIEPYLFTSRAVILRTTSGGARWTPVTAEMLPALNRIRMIDPQRGWAVGDPSPLFPSGVFKTSDGGRTWTTLPVGHLSSGATGDFHSVDRGVIATADGMLRLVLGAEIAETRTPDLDGRPLHGLLLDGPSSGWLVGAGGLVFTTADGGVSWRRPTGSLPVAASSFDFWACASSGSSVWIAGAPGSFIFHSADRGESWRVLPTGQNIPIRDLHFATPNEGWAVGDLGCILHTRNGGASWEVQRQGGNRLALWVVTASEHDIPLDLIAAECGGSGYLGRATVLFPKPSRFSQAASVAERTHAAVLGSGGSGADASWKFPIADQEIAVSSTTAAQMLDRVTDGLGRDELMSYLVQQLRQWRPSVVVVDDPSNGPFASMVFQQMMQAVVMAGDATAYAEQITSAGLEAHRVSRVFAMDAQGRVQIQTSMLLPTLGASVADYASRSRGLLQSEFASSPATIALRRVYGPPARRGLMDGISDLEPARGARRRQGSPLLANMAQLQSMIQKGRTAREFLQRSETVEGSRQEFLLGQLDDLTGGVDARAASELTFQLGSALHRQGKSEFAAEAFSRLAARHPESPLAQHALVWLVQYYASGEARHLTRSKSSMRVANAKTDPRMQPARPVAGAPNLLVDPAVRPAQATSEPAGLGGSELELREATAEITKRRDERASHFAKLIQQTRPALYEDPRLRFPFSVAQRRLGVSRNAEGFFRRSADPDAPEGWREAAQAEIWLTHMQGKPPKPLHPCFQTLEQPRLDGLLQERVWQVAQPMELETSSVRDNLAPTKLWFAYDHQYLYLAAACHSAIGEDADQAATKASSQTSTRKRDTDLSQRDRLVIRLDVDRDYATAFQLEIDDRGWANDSFFDNIAWNPQWYIAHRHQDQTWVMEAAIPWTELIHTPAAEQAWAVDVRRVTPDVQLQSWPKPSGQSAEKQRMGLLRFEGPR